MRGYSLRWHSVRVGHWSPLRTSNQLAQCKDDQVSYHHCPIEPSDWSDGPDDAGQFDECPDCDEGRFSREAIWIDGILYPAIVDAVCDTCGGNGIVFREDDEDDYDLDDLSCC